MTGVLTPVVTLHIDTHTGEVSCEGEGRDRDDASVSQGMSKVANKHQKLGERKGTASSSEPSE